MKLYFENPPGPGHEKVKAVKQLLARHEVEYEPGAVYLAPGRIMDVGLQTTKVYLRDGKKLGREMPDGSIEVRVAEPNGYSIRFKTPERIRAALQALDVKKYTLERLLEREAEKGATDQ